MMQNRNLQPMQFNLKQGFDPRLDWNEGKYQRNWVDQHNEYGIGSHTQPDIPSPIKITGGVGNKPRWDD